MPFPVVVVDGKFYFSFGGNEFAAGMLREVQKMPGRMWINSAKKWEVPATISTAEKLKALGGYGGDEFNRYLEPGKPLPCLQNVVSDFKHQTKGLEKLWKYDGYMLIWEMGTGKTKTVIDYIRRAKSDKPFLICCPKTVMQTWIQEFERHVFPDELFIVRSYDKKTIAIRALDLLQDVGFFGGKLVAVINYDAVWRKELGEAVKKIKWQAVVADESQRIKNPKGKASKFFYELSTLVNKRIALTGTPMPHSPLDVFAQMRFVDAGIFGSSFYPFQYQYAVLQDIPIRHNGVVVKRKVAVAYKNLDKLHNLLDTRAMRVKKEDALDLPETTHVPIPIELDEATRKTYDRLEKVFVADVEQGRITATNALTNLLRLQQITGGHCKTDDGKIIETGKEKIEALKDILESLPPDESVVVFCWFLEDVRRIIKAAEELERPAFELRGGVYQQKEFAENARKGAVIAAQIRTGGLGINEFICSRYCVFYSLGFSLGDYEQAVARLHRTGQKHKVTYSHLIGKDTVDEKVYAALRKKKDAVLAVLEGIKGKTNDL